MGRRILTYTAHASMLGQIMPKLVLRTGDVAYLTSSIAEGIGTPTSDYDIHVLTDALPPVSRFDRSRYYWVDCTPTSSAAAVSGLSSEGEYVKWSVWYIDGDQHQVQSEYYLFQDVEEGIRLVDDFFARAVNSTVLTSYSFPEYTARLLHCLLVGVPLFGDTRYREVAERVDALKLRFLLYRSACVGFPLVKDIIGHWQAQNWDTAAMISRDYLISETLGLSHLLGNTNSRRKWLIEYLRKHVGEADSHLVGGFLALLGAPIGTGEEKKRFILDVFDFVDLLNATGREILISERGLPDPEHFLDLIREEAETAGTVSTDAKWEFAERMRKYVADPMPGRDLLLNYPRDFELGPSLKPSAGTSDTATK
jgi:hypothetical protein